MRLEVHGQAELERAFKQVRKETLRELRPALMAAAEPVRVEAAALFSRYDEKSASGYKVRVRLRGVAVEQSLRRTTGQHPSFGSLQMRTALEPALDQHQADVLRKVELMVDLNGYRAGF